MSEDLPPLPRGRAWRFALAGAVLLLVMFGVAVEGVFARIEQHDDLAARTAAETRPGVATVAAARGAAEDTLTLPGSARADTDAPIYARTSGYVKRWLADLGAKVERGALLAELDTPELDQALRQAEADEAVAAADEALAARTATRFRELFDKRVVPRQTLDEKTAEAEAARAALAARHANTQRLRELQDFRLVRAPFAGVITARKVDVGTLVNASGSSATQLFQLASIERVRVSVPVPQAYAAAARPGTEAEVRFATHPEAGIKSRVLRSASVIDPVSRTLLVELDVDNPAQEALAGAYVEVAFKLAGTIDNLRVPAATLLFRPDGLHVATVVDGDKVHLQSVTLGRDFGAQVEVVAGLAGGEQVIMNPPDSIAEGQAVTVVTPASK